MCDVMENNDKFMDVVDQIMMMSDKQLMTATADLDILSLSVNSCMLEGSDILPPPEYDSDSAYMSVQCEHSDPIPPTPRDFSKDKSDDEADAIIRDLEAYESKMFTELIDDLNQYDTEVESIGHVKQNTTTPRKDSSPNKTPTVSDDKNGEPNFPLWSVSDGCSTPTSLNKQTVDAHPIPISKSPKLSIANQKLQFYTNINLIHDGSPMGKRPNWFKIVKFPGRTATPKKQKLVHPSLFLYHDLAQKIIDEPHEQSIKCYVRHYVREFAKIETVFDPNNIKVMIHDYKRSEIIADIKQIKQDTKIMREMCERNDIDMDILYQMFVGRYYNFLFTIPLKTSLSHFVTNCVQLFITEPFRSKGMSESDARRTMVRAMEGLQDESASHVVLSGMSYRAVRETTKMLIQDLFKTHGGKASPNSKPLKKTLHACHAIDMLSVWMSKNQIFSFGWQADSTIN